jgi:hypothetical protein
VHDRLAFGAKLEAGGKGQKYAALIRAMWAGGRQTTTKTTTMTVGNARVRMCEMVLVLRGAGICVAVYTMLCYTTTDTDTDTTSERFYRQCQLVHFLLLPPTFPAPNASPARRLTVRHPTSTAGS